MLHGEAVGLLIGAVVLGAIHGVEPGHGWPIAASYALDQTNTWIYGFAASLILGVGHLISSLAMVLGFFYVKDYMDLTQFNEPIHLLGNVQIGGPVSIAAGVLLIGLAVREYRHGTAHTQGADPHETDPSHDDRAHPHDTDHAHSHQREGRLSRLREIVPFTDGHDHSSADLDGGADRGLLGIAWVAFLLGFAHEEEFEIIALCAGSAHCLELMSAYALTVIVGIVGLTMLLIMGYQHFETRVERYTPYLPAVSATVLGIMGVGFIAGIF